MGHRKIVGLARLPVRRVASSWRRSLIVLLLLPGLMAPLDAQASSSDPGGSDWSVVPSANVAAEHVNSHLADTTCMSESDCWAVGGYRIGNVGQTLIQRWDGVSWEILPSPNTSSTDHHILQSVTCASSSDCWAVGRRYEGGVTAAYHPLVLRWDGDSWTITPSPNVAGEGSILFDVTCASEWDCWAVGRSSVLFPGIDQTLIQRWDGSSWSMVPSPNAPVAQGNALRSVACSSESDCWAVGISYSPASTQTLIGRWNGTAWVLVPSPNVTDRTFLDAVTCASSSCWTVGSYIAANGRYQTLIQRWDGASWVIVPSPNTAPDQNNHLVGVTCASPSECWGVGNFTAQGLQATLIQRWDGATWNIIASPNGSAPLSNVLRDVACASSSDCWAVGRYVAANGRYRTLIQRWDGESWSVIPSPNTSATEMNWLNGVDCVSASSCFAVGGYGVGADRRTLVQQWDGASWDIVPSPNTGTDANFLSQVSCISESDCWAVGSFFRPSTGRFQTLMLRWDGDSWAIVDSPNVSTRDNFLRGVTCVSALDCWAVGEYYTDVPLVHHTLIQRWDGVSWTVVPSPNTDPSQSNGLKSVSCSSASDCWAVGQYHEGGVAHTLILRWDGASWTLIPSPNASPVVRHFLESVDCTSASDCWAVGYFSMDFGPNRTLILRWDGASWTVVPAPDPTASNTLRAVTCTSPGDCWAVGTQSGGGVSQTLTLRHTGLLSTPVTLAYEGPSAEVRGRTVTLSTRFSSSPGVAIEGRTLHFELGDFEREVATDEEGVARVEMDVDQSYGTHELKVSFAGDPEQRLDPVQTSVPFSVRWEHLFIDAGRVLRVNTVTSELQFAAPGDVSGVKTDPDMTVGALPTGETLIEINYTDEELTVVGRFILERQTFAAVVRTDSGAYILRRTP